MPARPHVIRDSCLPAKKPVLRIFSITVEGCSAAYKGHAQSCNLLTNIVLRKGHIVAHLFHMIRAS
jgi:hypothetical protein